MATRRNVSKETKEILRREVGFCCPMQNCGNPYLEYYHFDSAFHFNDINGMIALCHEHYKKAENNTYTVDNLHEVKENKKQLSAVNCNLKWLDKNILSIVGDNAFYDTPIPIQIDGHNIIKFTRDDYGAQKLSIEMLSTLPEERAIIDENSWENIGSPIVLISPPTGKELAIKYNNGDYLYLKFKEVDDQKMLRHYYGIDMFGMIDFPITVVEINMKIAGTNIEFKTSGIDTLRSTFSKNISIGCAIGLSIDTDRCWLQNQKWKLRQKYKSIDKNVFKVNFDK